MPTYLSGEFTKPSDVAFWVLGLSRPSTLVPTWTTMLSKLVSVFGASNLTPYVVWSHASTLRLASMLVALAQGRQITFAGECSLTLCVTESPMTSVFTPRKRLAKQAAVHHRKWCCRQGCLGGVTANESVSSTSPPGGSLLYTFWSICFLYACYPFIL